MTLGRLIVLAGLMTATLGGAALRPVRPNIILILIDDQRHDFLSFRGHPWIRTPHIDRLASRAMYFDNAFVTTSLCSPSRASILTGRYTHSHGVMDNDTELPAALPTFPRELQRQGYYTGFIGKWHMGGSNSNPRPGFDRWVSFRGQGSYNHPTLNIDGEEVATSGYTPDVLTEHATAFVRERAAGGRPYLLYLSHKSIHEPFTPADRHAGAYRSLNIPAPEEPDAGKPDWVRRQTRSWHGAYRNFSINQYGDFNHFFQKYSECMLAVDESVGRLTAVLTELGQLDDTVIIYFSDNGYHMGEHGLIDKRVMYEESIRVPCFVHYPRLISKGSINPRFVLNIDIAPTILELGGTVGISGMHGRSIVPLLRDEPASWREDFLYEYFVDPNTPQTPTIFGLRTHRYSYMTYHGVWAGSELYDVGQDPRQKSNLLGAIWHGQDYGTFLQRIRAQDPALFAIVGPLHRRMEELLQSSGGSLRPGWQAPANAR